MISYDMFETLNPKKKNHCVHSFYILFYDVKLCISLLLVLFFESHWTFFLWASPWLIWKSAVALPSVLILNTDAGKLPTPATLSYFLCGRKWDSQTRLLFLGKLGLGSSESERRMIHQAAIMPRLCKHIFAMRFQ